MRRDANPTVHHQSVDEPDRLSDEPIVAPSKILEAREQQRLELPEGAHSDVAVDQLCGFAQVDAPRGGRLRAGDGEPQCFQQLDGGLLQGGWVDDREQATEAHEHGGEQRLFVEGEEREREVEQQGLAVRGEVRGGQAGHLEAEQARVEEVVLEEAGDAGGELALEVRGEQGGGGVAVAVAGGGEQRGGEEQAEERPGFWLERRDVAEEIVGEVGAGAQPRREDGEACLGEREAGAAYVQQHEEVFDVMARPSVTESGGGSNDEMA